MDCFYKFCVHGDFGLAGLLISNADVNDDGSICTTDQAPPLKAVELNFMDCSSDPSYRFFTVFLSKLLQRSCCNFGLLNLASVICAL